MRITYLLLFILLLGVSSTAYAGFIISRPAHILPDVSAYSTDNAPATDSIKRLKSRAETFSGDYKHTCRQHQHREKKSDGEKGGWLGIAALVCACVYEWPLAILFGGIGMSKKYKNHRLARGAFIAGLVEGALELLIVILILVAVSSSGGVL